MMNTRSFRACFMQTTIFLLFMFCFFPLSSYAHIMTADDYKSQVKYHTETIKNNPNDLESYYWRGGYYFCLNMDTLAMLDLNKAIDLNLQQLKRDSTYRSSRKYYEITSGSYALIARIYKRNGNWERTFENYTKAIETLTEMAPNNICIQTSYANLLTTRADMYIERKKYPLAVADLTTAIASKKEYANFYVAKRASIYVLMGEYDKAIEDYNHAIIYNKYWAKTISDRGDVYTKLGKYDNAFDDYNTALGFNVFPSALIGRATIYTHYGETDKAIADYTSAIVDCEKAFQINANYFMPAFAIDCAKAYYSRGKLYYEQGKYDNAVSDCAAAIKLKSDYTDALNLKILLEQLQNK